MIQERFHAQIKVVLDKLTEAEHKLCGSSAVREEKEHKKEIEVATATNASAVKSVAPQPFQDLNKKAAPATFRFQSPGGKGLSGSQLFTIGRGESSEDTADDEIQ